MRLSDSKVTVKVSRSQVPNMVIRICIVVAIFMLVMVVVMGVSSPVPASKTPRWTGESQSYNQNSDKIPDSAVVLSASSSIGKYAAGELDGVSKNQDIKVISAAMFPGMIKSAKGHPRKRKMIDLTKDPPKNSIQTLMNTWIEDVCRT